MKEQQTITTQMMTVRVSGTGNSKQKALAAALAKVQTAVLQNSSAIILRIEPVDIDVISAYADIFCEKFLFFFLPRKKECYAITVDITVKVSLVAIDEIKFVSRTGSQ
ncbi:DUF4312 family protein [Orbaceae bacterium ESL0727]|nr:DUF4312 family protein [Orbaceae bacterium ESL0727]